MKFGLSQILRFELGRLLNIYGGSPEYRWTYRPDRDRIKVAMRRLRLEEQTYSLRKGTSDFEVFYDIFHRLQYSTSTLARNSDILRRYTSILEAGKRPLIVDAGANIGLSAMYFRHVYPEAVIVAVEPETGNFKEMCQHIGDDPLLLPLQAAIGPADSIVEILDEGRDAWGFRTRSVSESDSQAGTSRVQAFSVRRLIDIASERWPVHPFMLKVDIEGFEEPLFEGSPSWVDDFYVLMVELHDWMLPKSGSSQPFVKAVAGRERDFLIRGESIFSIANHHPSNGLVSTPAELN